DMRWSVHVPMPRDLPPSRSPHVAQAAYVPCAGISAVDFCAMPLIAGHASGRICRAARRRRVLTDCTEATDKCMPSCLGGRISSSTIFRGSSTCCASNVPKSAPRGRYRGRRVLEKYSPKANKMEWKEQLNGDCPRRDAHSMLEHCDLICPDLPKVL